MNITGKKIINYIIGFIFVLIISMIFVNRAKAWTPGPATLYYAYTIRCYERSSIDVNQCYQILSNYNMFCKNSMWKPPQCSNWKAILDQTNNCTSITKKRVKDVQVAWKTGCYATNERVEYYDHKYNYWEIATAFDVATRDCDTPSHVRDVTIPDYGKATDFRIETCRGACNPDRDLAYSNIKTAAACVYFPGDFTLSGSAPVCAGENLQNNSMRWTESADAAWYSIFAANNTGGWDFIASTTNKYYTHWRQPTIRKCYKVVAVNAAGQKESNIYCFPARDCTLPGEFSVKCSSLKSLVDRQDNILTWTPVESAFRYEIRRVMDDFLKLLIGTTRPPVTTFTDKNQSQAEQKYQIRAYSSAGSRNKEVICYPYSESEKTFKVGFITNKINLAGVDNLTIEYDPAIVNNPPPGFSELLKPEWFEVNP